MGAIWQGCWVFAMTVLQYSYAYALAGLYICGLLRIDALDAGYIGFFVVFLIFHTLMQKAWILLILYAQGVVLALYIWQVRMTNRKTVLLAD